MSVIAMVPFVFEAAQIRLTDQNGCPWFVLVDVCRVLGISNTSDAAGRLDDDEKGVVSIDTLGGPQEAVIVNESGLYSLILRSRKAEARRFKKWVTAEVLPSIRRTGQYSLKAKALDTIATAKGSFAITDAAKVLQLPPRKFFAYLYAHNWIYRRPNGRAWLGYSARAKQGLIEHKVFEHDGPDGNPRVREQCRITAKGLAHLAEALAATSAPSEKAA